MRLFCPWFFQLVLGACAASFAMACVEGPTALEGAAYFGLSDGAEHSYIRSNGLTEIHSYERVSETEEEEVFERIARSGGFIVDDRTLTLEATADGLYITRLHDCVTLCGELSKDLLLFNWPIDDNVTLEQSIDVTVTRNNVDEGAHTEDHRVVIGSEEERSINGTTYLGFDALWTRTIDDDVQSARLFVVPEVGIASLEGFDGVTLEIE
ncbi:MAG: hypothetical protein GY822_11665 [Deltaproteobacteria bacterium]|nr:hypothetical protein [Deltaproteobacteria bacterium]